MAQVANPHKRFQFSIFLFGMNPFLAQKVTLPDREIDIVEHGEGNHLIKTGGMVKFSQLMIEKLLTGTIPDSLIWGWINLVQNEFLGGGTIPEVYKKAVNISLLGIDGVTVINTWTFTGCWPNKINGIELDRLSSDNTIESIEFCVDKEFKTP